MSDAEKVRGDVHHLVQPVIGLLRLTVHDGQNIDPATAESLVRRLRAVLAIVDTSVGLGETREQLASTYRDLGLGL